MLKGHYTQDHTAVSEAGFQVGLVVRYQMFFSAETSLKSLAIEISQTSKDFNILTWISTALETRKAAKSL